MLASACRAAARRARQGRLAPAPDQLLRRLGSALSTVRRLGGEAGRQPAFCGLLSVGLVSPARPPLSYQPSRALALTAAKTDAVGLQYLQTRLGLDEPEMAAMERQLMFCPDEDRIRSSLDGLQGRLGLSDAELRKMVRTMPSIIGCSFEGNIKPTLDAVQGHLGLSDDELRKMVRTLPAIISFMKRVMSASSSL